MGVLTKRSMALVRCLWRRLRRSLDDNRLQQRRIANLEGELETMRENLSLVKKANAALEEKTTLLQICLCTGQIPMEIDPPS